MYDNKQEVEIFYKTHNLNIKEVAEHFNISYRTIARWAKKGGWIKGEAIEKIEVLEKKAVQQNNNKVLCIAKETIKEEIKHNLGEVALNIDSVILNNALESSTDALLTNAMNLNYIQKNIALSAILSKDALMRMVANSGNPKDDPILIACAEKVAKIFTDLKVSIYGKDAGLLKENDNLELDIERLSNEELKMLLAKAEKERQEDNEN
ncbi:MAG: helix-turn-helix domain-containing protein [Helicobacteraceae bacterium]|nr:helix-turn-helix domain-containing protein [Helicobacteraceae bacterium]